VGAGGGARAGGGGKLASHSGASSFRVVPSSAGRKICAAGFDEGTKAATSHKAPSMLKATGRNIGAELGTPFTAE
jgi:N-methylhydantoinase A/oxoprolinase/acetone carboxylase beta subunit